ncbi:MAG: HAD family hydrolase [Rhodospirillaceae bacterium]
MKIEALLFDLGGVVIEIDLDRVWQRWARDARCRADAIRRPVGMFEPYLRYECGAIALEEFFGELRKALGITLSDAELLAGWNEIFVGEMAGIGDVLAQLRPRIPLFAFSNTNQAHVDHFTPRFAPVLSHFNKVFLSSSIGLRKPDKPAFDHVVAEIGMPAGAVLFFDDSKDNVAGARAAGLQAEHVRNSAEIAAALKRYGV